MLNVYRPYYAFTLNIGDVPSQIESYTSTDNVITNVVYNALNATTAYYTCTVNSANVFGGADYNIILTYRSLRPTLDSADNDLATPIVALYQKTSFVVFVEETFANTQNIAVDGLIVRRPV